MNDIASGVTTRGFVRGPDVSGDASGTSRSSTLNTNPPGLLAGGRGAIPGLNRTASSGGDTGSTQASATGTTATTVSRQAGEKLATTSPEANPRATTPDAGVRPPRGASPDSAQPGQPGGERQPVDVPNRGTRTTPDGVVADPRATSNGTPSGGGMQNGPGAQGSHGGAPQGSGGQPQGAQETARNVAAANTLGNDRGAGAPNPGSGQAGGLSPGAREGAGRTPPGGGQGQGNQQGSPATDLARAANHPAGQPSWAAAGSSSSSSSLIGGLLSGAGGLVGSLVRTPQPLLAKLGGTLSMATSGLSTAWGTMTGALAPGLPFPGGIVTNLAQQLATHINPLTSGTPTAAAPPGPSMSTPAGSASAPAVPNAAHFAGATLGRPEALMSPGAGTQPMLPGVLGVARAERAMTAHSALQVASQTANAPVRAGTANLMSMAGASAGAAALATANLSRNSGAGVLVGAGQQAAAPAAQSLPSGQRPLAATHGPAQGRVDTAALAGSQPGAQRPVSGNAAGQMAAATIAPAATPQAAAASSLVALAAAGAVSGELGVQSREAGVGIDREREQGQPVDRNQAPTHVFAADIGRQPRSARLEKSSILGRLLSALSGARGEGVMNAPENPLSNSRMKSTQTMMWVVATVAFGSVAAGMTVFWNSGALGVLATPSAQALTVFALIGIAAGGAIAAWRAITGVESPEAAQSGTGADRDSPVRSTSDDDTV